MLDHVSIAVADIARAVRFYDAAMAALGVLKVWQEPRAAGYGLRSDAAEDGRSYLAIRVGAAPADPACHWCFRAPDLAAVRAFHAAGLAAGGADDGAPGLRAQYHAHYHAAFLRDPDGNRIEAACNRAKAPSA